MTPEEHRSAAERLLRGHRNTSIYAGHNEDYPLYYPPTDRDIAQAQVHATLAADGDKKALADANKALDKVAKYAAPNDAPGWSDSDGLLESICNTIESTGRTINWEGNN